MPAPRMTDDEAHDLTAFLITLKREKRGRGK